MKQVWPDLALFERPMKMPSGRRVSSRIFHNPICRAG
jgi:hypothetical protein